MKRNRIFLIFFLFYLSSTIFSNPNLFNEIDNLVEEGKLKEAENLLNNLLKASSSNWEKAEIYWRLSRNSMLEGQQKSKEKLKPEEIVLYFEKGAFLASEAIKYNSSNPQAYFWRASNWGSWCQVKKNLEALGKIELMKKDLETAIKLKPDFGMAYFVLGTLYSFLPGWPISFGNKIYAISLFRQAVDLIEKKEDTLFLYFALCSHLKERNWDSETRMKKRQEMLLNYKQKQDLAEKACFYEGFLDFTKPTIYSNQPLALLSDKQEALFMVEYLERLLPSLKLKAESLENSKKAILELKAELR